MENTATKVKEIIQEQLCCNQWDMTSEAKLINDLGADDLDVAEMLMACEEEFNVEITDAECDRIVTVGDLVKLMEVKTTP